MNVNNNNNNVYKNKIKSIKKSIFSFEKENGHENSQPSIEIILRLLKNISKHPNQEKFFKVPMNNKKIKKTLVNMDGAIDILTLIGFEINEEQTYFVLPIDTDIEFIKALYLSIEKSMINWRSRMIKYEKRLKKEKNQQFLNKIKQERKEIEESKAHIQVTNSVANNIQFGARTSTFSDIGVDLNKGGG
eukprot:TRINITY_DN2239_c2_g1_i1.p1 TRINITY_DN2239_c2_g1~~TRINITY_DN2239_c2_g1_i1.p1  ORF type:complete len:189 (-),score=61.64 TRINITY_DN2239_c2_g1_i1:300-866(-)